MNRIMRVRWVGRVEQDVQEGPYREWCWRDPASHVALESVVQVLHESGLRQLDVVALDYPVDTEHEICVAHLDLEALVEAFCNMLEVFFIFSHRVAVVRVYYLETLASGR